MTRTDPRPLHEQIASSLREAIEAGEYPPGARLPSEAQLREVWGVSRGPVRHAIQTLTVQGFVQRSQGRSAVVRAQPVPQSADSYTPFSQWARAAGYSFGQQTQSFSMHPASPETAARLGVGVGERVYDMVRLRLLNDRPCMVERSTFTDAVGPLLMRFDLDSGGISDYLAGHGVHYSVIEQQLDAVAADALDANLLGVSPGQPLLRVRRTSATDDGVIWEISDDRYRSDYVTFQTSFRRVSAV